jgi:hypothetical protein
MMHGQKKRQNTYTNLFIPDKICMGKAIPVQALRVPEG